MATIAIFMWPFIALVIFARLPAVPGLIWGILLPYLFLPEAYAFNLPGLPDLNKESIIAIGVFLGFWANRQKFSTELANNPITVANHHIRRLVTLSFCLIFGGIIVTVLSNNDPLRIGFRVLPAMRLWDAVAMISDMLFFIVPFLFARTYLARPDAHHLLLRALAVMGLVYSFFVLVEIRFSPQLHNWIYGYFQHSFIQHVRNGFRPMVFLYHGLWVGFFLFMATIAAFTLWQSTRNTKWLIAGGWVFVILALSQNLAALLIAILALLLMFTLRQRMQILVALVIAWATLFYPMLRQSQLVPLTQIMSAAATISQDRAASLLFRLENEDQLLDKALQRPIAGWGGYSRERIYDESGRDISTSDGLWIQAISTRGWIGYIGLFGLLNVPLLFLLRTRQRKPIPAETLGLVMIIIGNLIYMIPNGTLTAIGWLVFGALAGFVQYDSKQPAETSKNTAQASRMAKNRYTRFQPQNS